MKTTPEWITYRTRFLVKAKQLQHSLTFTDVLGRQHNGRKGDYMVESSDGVLSIAPRQIFEDVYVPMSSQPNGSPAIPMVPSAFGRKSPQPYRDRRSPSASLRFL